MAAGPSGVPHLQSQRQLITFPISPSIRAKVTGAGFLLVADLNNLRPSELSKEAGISLEDALEVLRIVSGENRTLPPSKSALQLLEEEQRLPNIVTFCSRLDAILGGGVAVRQITEICGAPGVGKTQMCIQIAVDVTIPEALGGLGGEAIYIDTEGSFIIERVVDIAKATSDHCHRMAAKNDAVKIEGYAMEDILTRIHYFRCHDYIELLATVHSLTSFLPQHPKVKVVIVDSIAFPFRHGFDDLSLRTRLLASVAQNCIQIATKFNLAVVLTNQMTTRFTVGSEGESRLTPALGESWAHACTVRLVLYWENCQRHAKLYKSPTHPEATVVYIITTGGIRDSLSKKRVSCDMSQGQQHQDAKETTKLPKLG